MRKSDEDWVKKYMEYRRQKTRTYNTANSPSQPYHIHSSPEMVMNADSTIWHLYTGDYRGQLIAYIISNLDHISSKEGDSQ